MFPERSLKMRLFKEAFAPDCFFVSSLLFFIFQARSLYTSFTYVLNFKALFRSKRK